MSFGNLNGYIKVKPVTSYSPATEIPVKRADLTEYVQTPSKATGYVTGEKTPTSTDKPGTSPGQILLTNGQSLPLPGTMLYSTSQRLSYYLEKELTTRFQPIGKSIDECSRKMEELAGLFTGRYFFDPTRTSLNNPSGLLVSMEVLTKFPFTQDLRPVETEYKLWIPAMVSYPLTVGYPLTGVFPSQQPTNNGYTDTPGGATDNPDEKPAEQAKKSNMILLAAVGLCLLMLSGKKGR